MNPFQSALQQAQNMAGNVINSPIVKAIGNVGNAIGGVVSAPFQPGAQFGPMVSPLPAQGTVMPKQTEQWRVDENGNTVPRFKTTTPSVTPSVQVQTPQNTVPSNLGGIARNPNAKNFNISPIVIDAINKAASYYGIPASILGDIALQESSFDPNKTAETGGYDGKTIDPATGKPRPYSTSQGLFMINDPTWTDLQNYKSMKGSTLSLPNNNRQDPYTSAMAAAYLIKHGQLGRWNPSAGVWAPNYTYAEMQPYYSQTAEADRPSPTIFKQ